jgi:hypothetical protein
MGRAPSPGSADHHGWCGQYLSEHRGQGFTSSRTRIDLGARFSTEKKEVRVAILTAMGERFIPKLLSIETIEAAAALVQDGRPRPDRLPLHRWTCSAGARQQPFSLEAGAPSRKQAKSIRPVAGRGPTC